MQREGIFCMQHVSEALLAPQPCHSTHGSFTARHMRWACLAGHATGAGGRGGAAKIGAMPASRAGLQKLAGVDGGEDAVNRAVAACIPVGHVGAKWDIAIAAVFLASPAARFISGPPPATPAGLASCALLRFRASLLQGLGSDVKKFPLNATLVSIAAYATGLMVAANAPGSHRREVVHDLEHVAFMRVTVHSA